MLMKVTFNDERRTQEVVDTMLRVSAELHCEIIVKFVPVTAPQAVAISNRLTYLMAQEGIANA